MARSTYYYWVKQMSREDKYNEVKESIKQIFQEHQGRYGYRRITLELRNQGYTINHKTVLRLMNQLGLKSLVRITKYRSYRGKVGKVAPNVLKRDFKASKPNEKWVTDVTEVHLFGEKLYLSPILDLFNGEIISYNIEKRPTFLLVERMLDKALKCLDKEDTPILHSDQGWHYQMDRYQYILRENNITQSMSRKGNCLDNAVIENFFGLLKSELLYLKDFESMEHFREELENYIYYYNNKRIKAKLKRIASCKIQNSILISCLNICLTFRVQFKVRAVLPFESRIASQSRLSFSFLSFLFSSTTVTTFKPSASSPSATEGIINAVFFSFANGNEVRIGVIVLSAENSFKASAAYAMTSFIFTKFRCSFALRTSISFHLLLLS